MNGFDLASFAEEFLGFIELQEVRLLAWGFYDVAFGAEELEDLIDTEAHCELAEMWEAGRNTGLSLIDVLGELKRSGLLHEIEGSPGTFRSRFAEGVRLMARLRQMFKPADWSSGPTLVSDVKMRLAPRRYPRRDQKATDCWRDLEGVCGQRSLQEAGFLALSSDSSGRPFEFAHFQRRAFVHVLSRYRGNGVTGTVISAGTGSGKTKAFYVPALLGIAADLLDDPGLYTKVIAVYPRNVLLADQLREALSEAAKLRPVLERFGLRPITFGALLGDTPKERWLRRQADGSSFDRRALRNWKPLQGGMVVPFVASSSGKELIWRDIDRAKGRTCLFQADAGEAEPIIADGIMRLTREQLQQNPPDILFLSTEMLNREMGNTAWSKAFGIGVPSDRRPRLLLLDEVHAYEGVAGAQIAWVLRRWRHWAGMRNLHVVGLSATLKEARKHLCALADVRVDSVQEFRPDESEFTTEAMEYSVALKGDPGSGASLLATTIQTGMLLARLLTPSHKPLVDGGAIPGQRLFGRKVFGFTDSLDALNRWFSDFSDAEKKRLARLRLPPGENSPEKSVPRAEELRMDNEGQIWRLPQRLGHDLSKPLRVSRCSSQDPGANASSDFIVATASLEVGYDDPLVGAILHHKKPASIASFVQRKGRAGRTRGTRPWTVVVLSDFGGDRWAFQDIERLFDPEVESIFLPINNPFVLRMQATYFLIDWLGRRVGQPDPFLYLSGPGRNTKAVTSSIRILKSLLSLGSEWHVFRRDLVRAFGVGASDRSLGEREIDDLLWSPPRSIMLHVAPSLLRKLEFEWRYADPKLAALKEDRDSFRPLPEFLPGATFTELESCEARLVLDGTSLTDAQVLPAARLLYETTPGRVSKRFATTVGSRGYWLAFSERLIGTEGKSTVPVSEVFPQRVLAAVVDGIAVFQPIVAVAKQRPERILDTSNASWQWDTGIRPVSEGRRVPVFTGSYWSRVFRECRAHLHTDHDGLEVVRFARSCRYEIRTQRGGSCRGLLTFGPDAAETMNSREAVGFTHRVDGIAFKVDSDFVREIPSLSEDSLCRLRVDYFLDRMRSSEELVEKANHFQVEWLWRTSVSMLAATAVTKRINVREAAAALDDLRPQAAHRVLESVLRSQAVIGDEDDGDGRRTQEIVELWSDPAIAATVSVLERECLWGELDHNFDSWLRRRFVATLAQALRVAAVGRQADVTEEDLAVDVVWRSDGSADIYLTERNSGGLGQIEQVVDELRGVPDLFHEAFRNSVAFCQRDNSATSISTLLEGLLAQDTGAALRDSFASVRNARGFQELAAAKDELRLSIENSGLPSSRSFVVSVASRLLRPGSSQETDALIAILNRAMLQTRKRAGIALEPRVFAYLCVQYAPARRRLSRALERLSGGNLPTSDQLYAVLQSLLIPQCKESCPECLDKPNRYNSFGVPARSVSMAWLELEPTEIRVSDYPDTWITRVRSQLGERARVSLLATSQELSEVARTLQVLLAEEIAVGYLLLPVSIASVTRKDLVWNITLQLREATHGD